MNALKLVALALTVVCGITTAQTSTTGSLSNVSLLELVNEAKAAAVTNPDLAALLQDLGDVSKLSEAELTKLVKSMLAVTNGSGSSSGSSSGSINIDASSSTADKSTTTAPVVTPKNAASSVALAPAAVTVLLASIVYTLV